MKFIKTLKIDINKNNFEIIPSVQYDSNTRYLHVYLFNNSLPFDITGCSVKIAGMKADNTDIFNDCKIIDPKKGFIEIKLTEQMNAAAGSMECELKIYSADGVLTTKTFIINISKSVTRAANITSSNEFNALTDALNKVQGIDNKADKVEVEEKFEEFGSQLEHKANLNSIFTMANMGQDVKEAMTGGSVAVVGKNTILTENIVDKQVTTEKATNDVISRHPFTASTTLKADNEKVLSPQTIWKAVKDIKLFGTDFNKNYNLRTIARNNNGIWSLQIFTTNPVLLVSQFDVKNYTELEGFNKCELSEVNNSGVTGYVIIDWSQLPNNINWWIIDAEISKQCQIKTIDRNIVDDEVLSMYPFHKRATLKAPNLFSSVSWLGKAIKHIELNGADKTKKYHIKELRKNIDNLSNIRIYRDDIFVSGIDLGEIPSDTTIQELKLSSKGVEGIECSILLDWSLIPNTQLINMTYDISGIDITCYKESVNNTIIEHSQEFGLNGIDIFKPCERLNSTTNLIILYVDKDTDTIYAKDGYRNRLIISTDKGLTWSSDKTYPANSNKNGALKVWKGNVYFYGLDTSTGEGAVWKSVNNSGNTPYDWTKVHSYTNGAKGTKTTGDANNSYIFTFDYGVPTSAPTVWRSADGDTWSACYQNSSLRHIHDVKCDPYNEGHVYVTTGDVGVNEYLLRSKNNGDTWEVINTNEIHQSLQISFTEDYVYLANDWHKAYASVSVFRKSDGKLMYASTNSHRLIPVPNATPMTSGYEISGDNPSTNITGNGIKNRLRITVDDGVEKEFELDLARCDTGDNIANEMQSKINSLGDIYSNVTVEFKDNKYVITSPTKGCASTITMSGTWNEYDASGELKVGRFRGAKQYYGKSESFAQYTYWGIVDKDTGIYYTVTTDPEDSTQKHGLFYLPKVGGELILLEKLPNNYPMGFEMFISDGYLYFGCYKRPLIKKEVRVKSSFFFNIKTKEVKKWN